MAIGLRLRGAAGNLQVSETNPVNMVLYSGTMSAANFVPWYYSNIMQINFPATVTTTEPPLIYLRIDNSVDCGPVNLIGSPGAWTGFYLTATKTWTQGDPWPRNDYSAVVVNGAWFITTTVVPKSSAPIGIRIRHSTTNQIIFDTGYPLVKFRAYLPNWTASGKYLGNNAQMIYVSPAYAGSYYLASAFTGWMSVADGGNNEGMCWLSFNNPMIPGYVALNIYAPLGNYAAYMRSFGWCLIWCDKGF